MELFNNETSVVTLDRARELMPDCKLSDEELTEVLYSLKQLSSVICAIYLKGTEKQNEERNESHNVEDIKMAA